MKSEPSEVKPEQSIKNGFNFTSQRFDNNWRKLLKKDRNVTNSKRRARYVSLGLSQLT